MLEAGVIETSCLATISPIVLVKKKDGTNKFCINFRRLNASTKLNAEPMGTEEQTPLEEESKPMTSFSTHNKSYHFRMMPFGLVKSEATFNKMMRNLLKGCDDVDNYMDDTRGHTVSWDSHLQMLRNVFTRIQKLA